jgi:putative AbiEi antitoxin of type IV toxin-antitoxin system
MPSEWSLNPVQRGQVTTPADLAVARLAAGHWGVVTHAELLACGLSPKAIEVRVARGNLHPLYRGIYAVGHHNLSTEGRFLAAVKACGDRAVLSHYSAACLHCLLHSDGRPFDVSAATKRSHPRITLHRPKTMERVVVKGIPVTPKLRTVIDLSKTAGEKTVKRAFRQARFSATGLERLSRGIRLIVEVDSREWHDDPLAKYDDAERQAELAAAGERVLRVSGAQMKRPRQVLARLRAAGVQAK